MGSGEGGGVVQPVADHQHLVAFGGKRAHALKLVAGKDTGLKALYAQPCCDILHLFGAVAGDDFYGDAVFFQVRNCLFRPGAKPVLETQRGVFLAIAGKNRAA